MERCAAWWTRAHASMFLCRPVPKVPKGSLGGFWHFWHPTLLGDWNFFRRAEHSVRPLLLFFNASFLYTHEDFKRPRLSKALRMVLARIQARRSLPRITDRSRYLLLSLHPRASVGATWYNRDHAPSGVFSPVATRSHLFPRAPHPSVAIWGLQRWPLLARTM